MQKASQVAHHRVARSIAAAMLLLAAVGAWGFRLTRAPSTERSHIEAGMEHARRKDGLQAEREWREATRQNPNSLEAWSYLSEYYSATRQWPAASESLRAVARLKPDAPHVQSRLAECSLRSGDERAAYRFAEEALKRDPNDAGAMSVLCPLLQRTGESKRQIEILRRLCSLQPENAVASLQLAEALVTRQLYTEANPVVAEILRRDSGNIEAVSLRGLITLKIDPSPKGLAAAEADLLHSLKEQRFAAFSNFHLGTIYKRQGKLEKAVSHLKEAAQSLPNQREVFFELADAYEGIGRPHEAALARRRFEELRQNEIVAGG